MGKQLGLLKIIVMQGKRLVIQDFKTSDPYVVLKLGNQLIGVSGKSVRSPLQLVTKFPNHPEIGTLHDNFV
ncbi:hypothetical protein glysoja_037280 [Glycine soja]|uniref:Uncharacterized protein n=1 Tax=Glycine soja TaxID=3848 RepID=A0A0B2NW63_GLYSO|nr:hypothetical protein glysoja_037280 [Glycine soja]